MQKHHSSHTQLAAAVGVLLCTTAGLAGAADLRFAERPLAGRYIVVLKEDAARLAAETTREALARPSVADIAREVAAEGMPVQRVFNHVLRGFVIDRADEKALATLLSDPRVEYIEEDGQVRASVTQNNATWGLDRIDQPNLPLNSTYVYNTAASNVHAYIIDTGIRASHSDFGGRVRSGYTAINDGQGTNDCQGHGTHVAGTVGSATYGVAKGVALYPVRVLGCDGSGSNSGIIAGMDWVRANRTLPAVANMSLGGGAASTVDTAVNNLVNSGVTVVVAAGNDNANACNYSPARAASAITVGATASNDSRSSFSNYGSCLDIFAPGSSILSTANGSNSATATLSGTSMASPHVAGVAALYLAANPSATPSQVASALNSGAVSNKVSNPGSGSPNRLVQSLLGGGGGPDPNPNPDPCTGCTKYSGSLSGSGSSAVQPNGTYYQSTTAGAHQGWLSGPSGTDFDLELYRWNGASWTKVAEGVGSTSTEAVSYNGSAGYYYWRVLSYTGSGSYSFWLKKPN